MTYSVVARDPESGAFGVAVQSHFFSTGAVVPWVEADVGAVATQASAQINYGLMGLEQMRARQSAEESLASLVSADPGQAQRQVAMVDRAGRAAAHTGARCIAHAGHRTGDGWSVQANMMRDPTVPDAMAAAFTTTPGNLTERLLATLDAAEAEGGDIRGRQSASLVISSIAPDGHVSADTVLRLHVEDHDEPLVELRRLVEMHRAYQHLSFGLDRALAGDYDAVLPALDLAHERAPGSTEIRFWRAVLLTMFGDPRGRGELDALFSVNPGWRELIPRLVASGTIPDTPGVIELLTRPRAH